MKETFFKKQLVNWVMKEKNPVFIACEFQYAFSTKRADIVYVDSEGIHAIEIKTKYDDLRRLNGQLSSYLSTFNTISIALEHGQGYQEKVKKGAVGIINVHIDGSISVLKKARFRTNLKKSNRLQLLNSEQTQGLCKKYKISTVTSQPIEILEEISKKIDRRKIEEAVHEAVVRKYRPMFEIFLAEGGIAFNADDVSLLEQKSLQVLL